MMMMIVIWHMCRSVARGVVQHCNGDELPEADIPTPVDQLHWRLPARRVGPHHSCTLDQSHPVTPRQGHPTASLSSSSSSSLEWAWLAAVLSSSADGHPRRSAACDASCGSRRSGWVLAKKTQEGKPTTTTTPAAPKSRCGWHWRPQFTGNSGRNRQRRLREHNSTSRHRRTICADSGVTGQWHIDCGGGR